MATSFHGHSPFRGQEDAVPLPSCVDHSLSAPDCAVQYNFRRLLPAPSRDNNIITRVFWRSTTPLPGASVQQFLAAAHLVLFSSSAFCSVDAQLTLDGGLSAHHLPWPRLCAVIGPR